MSPSPEVILTNLLKIVQDIGELKGDIGGIKGDVAAVNTKLDGVVDTINSQATRITTLEDSHKKVKWMALGAGTVVAGLWRLGEVIMGIAPHGH